MQLTPALETSRAAQRRRSSKATALLVAGLVMASSLTPAAMAQTATTLADQPASSNAQSVSPPTASSQPARLLCRHVEEDLIEKQ
jgi:anti-sigma factor RsiW